MSLSFICPEVIIQQYRNRNSKLQPQKHAWMEKLTDRGRYKEIDAYRKSHENRSDQAKVSLSLAIKFSTENLKSLSSNRKVTVVMREANKLNSVHKG